MSTIINARSPYYIKVDNSGAGGDIVRATIELFIWSGHRINDQPQDPVYTISKTTKGSQLYVVYEISELLRDYLQTEYYNNAQDAVWVLVNTKSFDSADVEKQDSDAFYLAIDGFGYFDEGTNPRTSTDPTQTSYTPMVLQSNTCINVVNGRDIRIPVFAETEPSATTNIQGGVWNFEDDFWEASEPTWDSTGTTITITDSENSQDKIQYLIIDSQNLVTGNTIRIQSTQGNLQEVTITINVICEPKFEEYRAIFYNKFGALQSYWLTKKSTFTTAIKSEQYHRNTLDFTSTPTYDLYQHNKQRFNIEANQNIQLNTPLQDECLNEPLEQMLMSAFIWLEDNSSVAPVNIKTESLLRLTGVNDKMIRYTLQMEYAYNKINQVR
jgi:hypothetical protein